MNEHTLEAWHIEYTTPDDGIEIWCGDDAIAVMFGTAWDTTVSANARLIAAAPDGYVIAERLVKSVKYWAKHEKYAACPICEGYRISEAAYEHGDLCPAFLAEKHLALVDKETR